MKKTFLIAMICIIITACGEQKSTPIVFPSVTPEPSFTATSTSILISTKIPPTEPTSTPTFTPLPPYSNKQVVFDYHISGNLADYSPYFFTGYCCAVTKLILYDDGQVIIGDETETYKQKVLSSNEIKQFLSKLETLGFYSLESNQQHNQTDELYDFGNNYEEINDGLSYCILVNANKSRKLCVHEPHIQFLIPKMKSILKYLDEYKPTGMTSYYPDRVLLSIQTDIDPAIDNPPAIPWDEYLPALETSSLNSSYLTTLYISGKMAKETYLFLERIHTHTKIVSQNDKEYIVYIRVLLPHEKITNSYP